MIFRPARPAGHFTGAVGPRGGPVRGVDATRPSTYVPGVRHSKRPPDRFVAKPRGLSNVRSSLKTVPRTVLSPNLGVCRTFLTLLEAGLPCPRTRPPRRKALKIKGNLPPKITDRPCSCRRPIFP